MIYAYIVLSIVGFHLPDKAFFLMTALSLIIIPIYLLINQNRDKSVKLLLVYSFGNLIDEIAGMATVRSVFEYLFAITALILICQKKKS